MNCQVIDTDFLCMMLGGVKGADGTIKVSSAVPNQLYTAEGTFRVTSTTGDTYKKIKFYSLKAQVQADLTLSATDVSSFSLVLDILADNDGNIIDIEDVKGTSVAGSKAGEPEVTAIKMNLEKK